MCFYHQSEEREEIVSLKARAMAWTQSSCRKIVLVPDSHSSQREGAWDGGGVMVGGLRGMGQDCLAVFDVMT